MPRKQDHRLKRIDRHIIDLGYLRGLPDDVFDQLMEKVREEATGCLRPVAVPERSKLVLRNITGMAASLSLVPHMASADDVEDDLLEVIGESGFDISKPSLLALLVRTAFIAVMAANTDTPEMVLPSHERALVRQAANNLVHGDDGFFMGTVDVQDGRTAPASLDKFFESLAERFGLDPTGDPAENAREVAARIKNQLQASQDGLDEMHRDCKRLEADVRRLSAENERLLAENESLAADAEHHAAARRNAEAAIDSVQADAEKTLAQAERIMEEAKAIDSQVLRPVAASADIDMAALVADGTVGIASAASLPSLVEAVHPNKMLFSSKARNDLEDVIADPKEIFLALDSLVEHYLPLARLGTPPESRTFKTTAGYDLSANESSTTKTNKRMIVERTASFDGEEVTTTLHLKSKARSGDNLFRIYFAYLPDHDAIGVVRIVRHLTTMGSKRRGF